MTAETRTVLSSALVCALGGPLVGLTIFLWFLADWPSLPWHVESETILRTSVIYLTYALILVGPSSAGLGAVGASLLVRWRRRTHVRWSTYAGGLGIGIVAGLLCLPVSLAIYWLPFAAAAGRWSQPVTLLLDRTTLIGPYATVGLATGAVLGLLVAFIVDRRVGGSGDRVMRASETTPSRG